MAAITEALESRQRERLAAYTGLVNRTAADEQIEPDEAEAVLHAAGRTPAELAGDVLIRVERNRLRLDIAHAREAENRFPALRAAIAAENEKLRWAIEQASAANRAAVFPLEQQLAEAQEQSRAASAASTKLHAGCQDKALVAREANLKQRQAGLGARLRDIDRTIRELAAHRKARRGIMPQSQNMSGRSRRAEASAAQLQGELASVSTDIEAVFAAMLEA